MSKVKFRDDDLFPRGQQLRARHEQSNRLIKYEADRARSGAYLEALVAASAINAHADGRIDLRERRKLVEAFLASPAFEGFSVAELAEELADHARAYSYPPHLAQDRALETLKALELTAAEKQSIRNICHKVIIADGLVHPVELGALHRIELAFGFDRLSGGVEGEER
ncbi:TerB family tellurite resistance protein [Devosia sp. BK]|uniref:TerB family tellurite resistance protein n=1 Tax=Devosia sp. BK TaxID=2871706 RepID=UPI00293B261D|nr:TerB family tellurite resistance protein [Devosia sp. BK]MDV3251004.1 TerB family tellurite resistance protein [Devosia sp. BK]